MTALELLYLDQWGNVNDRYDLGDFLGLLDRAGQSVSAEIMEQLLKLRGGGGDSGSDTGRSEPRPRPESVKSGPPADGTSTPVHSPAQKEQP